MPVVFFVYLPLHAKVEQRPGTEFLPSPYPPPLPPPKTPSPNRILQACNFQFLKEPHNFGFGSFSVFNCFGISQPQNRFLNCFLFFIVDKIADVLNKS